MAGRYAAPSELFQRDAETVIAAAARLSEVKRLTRQVAGGAVSDMAAQCGSGCGILPCNGLEE